MHSMAGMEQQSQEDFAEGSDPGSYLLLISKQIIIIIKQTTHYSNTNLGLVCQKFSLCKLFSSFCCSSIPFMLSYSGLILYCCELLKGL